MGRRKIEIQPITHERNRSVTFLKRKNGLFKKAYELGVLCSVDVAVIIFEERPGHHVKLYQYCSGDVQDIVQRHIRYDGEKDTRFPHDFANNANSGKAGDAADAEEEDPEEEEHESCSTVKKSSNPKLKQEYNNNGKAVVPPTPTDSNLGSVDVGDYSLHGLHRHAALPAPPLHPHSQLPSAPTAPSLPISTERHTSSRLPLSTNGQSQPFFCSATKLSGDEALLNSSYIPSPTSASSSGYRHNGSPASSLLGSSFDFPSSSSAPRGGHVPISRDGLYSQRSSTYPPLHNHDPQGQLQSVYQQQQPHHPSMRHSLGQHSHSNQSQSQSQPSDFFPEMLESADGHAHHSTHHRPLSSSSQLPHFTAMDWPTHGPATAAPRQTPPQEGGHQEPIAGQPPNNTSWLDFLSHGTSNSGHPLQLSLPSAERDYTNATSGMSGSEREAGVGIGGGGVGGGGLMMSPTSASRKRPRTTSCIEEGKRHSPLGIGISTSASGRKKEEG
ncbi:hypothetical protein F5J12DRAFT_965627 [Pisolithus orientalis]|uniref:uncharacterized protein n=1 Tax=Pisolithus orientalis TaxID=936130 RepID=UPI002224B936|nr:uncharacterized protein F5J12DRAFT_965627 [Pisolithus orientalis]KAI5992295.1 hypothetical protein F5J12DRAFT_965627 [Pisolithus orientalis]